MIPMRFFIDIVSTASPCVLAIGTLMKHVRLEGRHRERPRRERLAVGDCDALEVAVSEHLHAPARALDGARDPRDLVGVPRRRRWADRRRPRRRAPASNASLTSVAITTGFVVTAYSGARAVRMFGLIATRAPRLTKRSIPPSASIAARTFASAFSPRHTARSGRAGGGAGASVAGDAGDVAVFDSDDAVCPGRNSRACGAARRDSDQSRRRAQPVSPLHPAANAQTAAIRQNSRRSIGAAPRAVRPWCQPGPGDNCARSQLPRVSS